jgi:hypothetical protein
MNKREKPITQVEGIIEWPSDPSQRWEILEWFVKFSQTNIDELSPMDKAELVFRVQWYFGAWAANLLDFSLPPINSEEYSSKIKNFQKIVRKELDYALKEGNRVHIHPPLMINHHLERGPKSFVLHITPQLSTFEEGLPFLVQRILEGLPPTTIQQCLSCKKIFVNPSRRNKHFCCPRCMWRFNAEKYREKLKQNPPKYTAYLKKQRELMAKKYDEKIHAQHPKAKITKKRRGEKRKGD